MLYMAACIEISNPNAPLKNKVLHTVHVTFVWVGISRVKYHIADMLLTPHMKLFLHHTSTTVL